MTKTISTAIIAIVAIATMAFTFFTEKTNEVNSPNRIPANAEAHTIVNGKSTINWKGYKVTGQHSGTIDLKNGKLLFDGEKLIGGNFAMNMQSIICTDLEGGTAKKLEGHLKSADFFGVEKYPTASFKITKVVSRGKPGDYKIVGNLTIKKTTKEIKFNANIQSTDIGKIATATIKVDRSDFDIRYGSGSFFDALGDKTIYDVFDLSIKLVAQK